jgi:hypothetical protein
MAQWFFREEIMNSQLSTAGVLEMNRRLAIRG